MLFLPEGDLANNAFHVDRDANPAVVDSPLARNFENPDVMVTDAERGPVPPVFEPEMNPDANASALLTPEMGTNDLMGAGAHVMPTDVSMFTRTMRHLGKQAFLNGFEEGRAMSLKANAATQPPSFNSETTHSPSSNSRTPVKGRKRARGGRGSINDDDEENSHDESPCLKGRKSRTSTGKKDRNETFLMASLFLS